MAELSKAQITGIVTLAMILAGAVSIDYIDQTYYCQPEDNVKECYRLSSTGITCYMTTGSDRCTNGKWLPIKDFLNQNPIVISENSGGSSVAIHDEVWYIKDPNNENICYKYGSLRESSTCPN